MVSHGKLGPNDFKNKSKSKKKLRMSLDAISMGHPLGKNPYHDTQDLVEGERVW